MQITRPDDLGPDTTLISFVRLCPEGHSGPEDCGTFLWSDGKVRHSVIIEA